MSPDDELDILRAENEDLKIALGEMQVQLDDMGEALLAMARAADRLPDATEPCRGFCDTEGNPHWHAFDWPISPPVSSLFDHDTPPRPPRLGDKVYVLDGQKLLFFNGRDWEDVEPEDDLDFGGARTVRSDAQLIAEWRGPAENYWDHAAQINHEVAWEFVKMMESPESTQKQRNPLDDIAIEAHGAEDAPQGPPDESAGAPR